MKQSTLAPWAEPVPDAPFPMTAAKARLYLQRGVRLVWVDWPADRQIDVWRAGSDEPAATLGANDQLDGGDVLPGFTHPVADLFERFRPFRPLHNV